MSETRGGGYTGFRPRRQDTPNQSRRRQMLDMRRQKYFRFDMDDLLEEFKIGDNKTTIAAAILNKMSSHSMDDAFEYIDRLAEGGTLTNEKSARLKNLLLRYSKWR